MQKSRKKKEKKKQKNRTWMVIVLIMVYLGGLFVYAIPDLQKVALQKENEKAVAHFQEAVEDSQQDRSGEQTDSTSATSNQIPKNAQLYQEMQAYNQQIFSNGQSGLTDPWAYEQETLDLSKYGCDIAVVSWRNAGEDDERCSHAWADIISGAGDRQQLCDRSASRMEGNSDVPRD